MYFEEKERILKSVMEQIEPERTSRKKAQMKKLTSIAAIAVVVLLLGACAVKVFHLDEKLAVMIGGYDPVMEEVMTPIEDSCESNGIRIEGRQVIGDGHRMLISFDVISLDGIELQYGNAFEEFDVYLSNGLPIMGTDIYTVGEVSKNGKKMTMVVEVETEGLIESLKGDLVMTNLLQTKGSMNVVQEGQWKIAVEVDCTGVMQTFETDDTINIDGVVMEVGTVDISPISFYLDELKVTDEGKVPGEEWWWTDANVASINLVLENGEEIVIIDRAEGWHSVDDGSQWCEIQGKPYELVNVDDVVGLSFDGQVVKFK